MHRPCYSGPRPAHLPCGPDGSRARTENHLARLYTAILAELVGATGRVTAIEFDGELAARAMANLAQAPHVRVVHGDGTRVLLKPGDVIYVNAGATRPTDIWLDRLKEGGRLILPLTADGFPNRDVRHGAVFRIERRGPFNKGGAEGVTRLYRSRGASGDARLL